MREFFFLLSPSGESDPNNDPNNDHSSDPNNDHIQEIFHCYIKAQPFGQKWNRPMT